MLIKGGGHAMAAGLTVDRARLADLRAFFEETLGEAVADGRRDNVLKLDGALTARSATLQLYEMLERAGPYGQGHSAPVFAFPAHALRSTRIVGDHHVSTQIRSGDGAGLKAIAFRSADTDLGRLLLDPPPSLHLAGTIDADFWQGARRVQLRILDAAIPARVG